MFIIVYSSFIILNYGFLYLLNLCIEFMYLLFLNLLFLNLCIYYFKFMYWIYVLNCFIIFEIVYLFKSCIY